MSIPDQMHANAVGVIANHYGLTVGEADRIVSGDLESGRAEDIQQDYQDLIDAAKQEIADAEERRLEELAELRASEEYPQFRGW